MINGYQFLERIGQGAYGEIYKVRSLKFNQIFAGKVVFSRNKDEKSVNRAWDVFLSETNALLRLDHPNIIRIYDRFRNEDTFIIILEYCSGGSLWDYIQKNGPVRREYLSVIICDLCEAVSFAHCHGVAHRDIKPQNVLIDDFGRVKLADFGISILNQDDVSPGQDDFCRDFHCTIMFAPPEVIQRQPYHPMVADIWSLGITIVTIMNGYSPLQYASSQTEVLHIAMTGCFQLGAADRTIVNFVRKMLVVSPDNRLKLDDFKNTSDYRYLRSFERLPISPDNKPHLSSLSTPCEKFIKVSPDVANQRRGSALVFLGETLSMRTLPTKVGRRASYSRLRGQIAGHSSQSTFTDSIL